MGILRAPSQADCLSGMMGILSSIRLIAKHSCSEGCHSTTQPRKATVGLSSTEAGGPLLSTLLWDLWGLAPACLSDPPPLPVLQPPGSFLVLEHTELTCFSLSVLLSARPFLQIFPQLASPCH